jgi:hypothetical protein
MSNNLSIHKSSTSYPQSLILIQKRSFAFLERFYLICTLDS